MPQIKILLNSHRCQTNDDFLDKRTTTLALDIENCESPQYNMYIYIYIFMRVIHPGILHKGGGGFSTLAIDKVEPP